MACYVAAYIWRASCLDVARLQRNVICITFGQPLFSIPYVQEMIQIYPAFEQTLHLILDKEDIVPSILCYFGIGCILKSHALAKSASIPVKAMSNSSPEKLKTVCYYPTRMRRGRVISLSVCCHHRCRCHHENRQISISRRTPE